MTEEYPSRSAVQIAIIGPEGLAFVGLTSESQDIALQCSVRNQNNALEPQPTSRRAAEANTGIPESITRAL